MMDVIAFRFQRLSYVKDESASLSDSQFMWKVYYALSHLPDLEDFDKRFYQILREKFPMEEK